MNIQELLDSAKAEVPALKGLQDTKAIALLRYAFRQVAQQLAATEEGELEVQGLGRFRVKKVEREKDGEKVAGKRVIFKGVKQRKGKGGKKGKGAEAAAAE